MTKQQLPAVSLLTSDNLEDFKTTDKVVVVAFIAADDKASNQTFTALAESLRDEYIFGASNDASLAKAEGVKQPGIVLYKDFDEGKATFDKAFDEDGISKFIKTASTPLVGEVGPETYASYMGVRTILKSTSKRNTNCSRLVFLLLTSLPKPLKNVPRWPRP